jgi:hypothetical protein
MGYLHQRGKRYTLGRVAVETIAVQSGASGKGAIMAVTRAKGIQKSNDNV